MTWNQHPRSRAYFEKLEEFQIYAKEWESIIKKVNLKRIRTIGVI